MDLCRISMLLNYTFSTHFLLFDRKSSSDWRENMVSLFSLSSYRSMRKDTPVLEIELDVDEMAKNHKAWRFFLAQLVRMYCFSPIFLWDHLNFFLSWLSFAFVGWRTRQSKLVKMEFLGCSSDRRWWLIYGWSGWLSWEKWGWGLSFPVEELEAALYQNFELQLFTNFSQ